MNRILKVYLKNVDNYIVKPKEFLDNEVDYGFRSIGDSCVFFVTKNSSDKATLLCVPIENLFFYETVEP